ncbi:MAG: hypothetical protein ACRDRJ_34885 [Streptosporangiaceae bacterium]
MSMYRGYLADSGSIALASTSAVPLLYLAPTATNDANVCKIKLMIPGSSGAAPTSNADVIAQLYKVTGTVGGDTSLTPAQLSGNALAANTVCAYASADTGLTGLTISGGPLWTSDAPETSGASWSDDFENTGLEIALLPSAKYALYVTAAAGYGSDMNARLAVWFAE